ncbi:MAG: tRNA (adenosine(37)-N6)-threonylcarbamoyltransferase complex dimerization subunit type 1 TsaB [Ruminococcaceae bacterium]|nr:tRNA (adenosine(37)-N6)-threonylcarbamoyltransferase complex dimerization subunit type 1 TsaB [Oscillospiraceae bacterium]
MKILAIDSSALCASVALSDDKRRLSEAFINTTNTHSETLLTMVESVMKNAGVTADDIDMFACTVGPGSFTGVRIGVSLIKGLAFASNKPCVGVSTLEAYANQLVGMKGIIVAVSDARRCGLYNAVFVSDGEKVERLCEDRLSLPEELAVEADSLAKEKKMNLYYTGDGYNRVRSLAKSARVKDIPETLRLLNSYSVAQTALGIYESAKDKSVFTDMSLAATYLRPTQAERELKEKNKSEKSDIL